MRLSLSLGAWWPEGRSSSSVSQFLPSCSWSACQMAVKLRDSYRGELSPWWFWQMLHSTLCCLNRHNDTRTIISYQDFGEWNVNHSIHETCSEVLIWIEWSEIPKVQSKRAFTHQESPLVHLLWSGPEESSPFKVKGTCPPQIFEPSGFWMQLPKDQKWPNNIFYIYQRD